jgi:hypothetical protein
MPLMGASRNPPKSDKNWNFGQTFAGKSYREVQEKRKLAQAETIL